MHEIDKLDDIFRALESAPEVEDSTERGRAISELVDMEVPDHETLLGYRFLCRGGACLFVGPSGIGKSSASMQQDAMWAIGARAFGIWPSRPLRILTVQAENDYGDLSEMAKGIVGGFKLSDEALATMRRNTLYLNQMSLTGKEFLAWLHVEILSFQPDLVRIDPLQAFLGADPKDTEKLSTFCRAGLNPMMQETGCAFIVNHHTPKTNFRNTETWRAEDWMYAGAGAADLTNWARAVIVIDPCETRGLFRFIGAKRGRRIGWRGPSGEPVQERFFKHAEHGIYWVDADPEEVKSARKVKRTKADLLELVPQERAVKKASLLSDARDIGISPEVSRGWISSLVDAGMLVEVAIPNEKSGKGSRPYAGVKRHLFSDPSTNPKTNDN